METPTHTKSSVRASGGGAMLMNPRVPMAR
jgi:hypothetical protein